VKGLPPVTLRTQGTIIPSDRSIRSGEKAGARVSSLGRQGETGKAEASKAGKAEAGKAGARRLGRAACLTLEAWLRGGEVGKICVKGCEDKGDTRRGEEKNWEDESMIPVYQFWGFLP
jgi:hypothetical protein